MASLYEIAARRRPALAARVAGVALLGVVGLALFGCDTLTIPGLGGSGSTPPAVVGRLTATSSDVRVERSGQSVTYAAGMPLWTGDRVRTGPAAFAAIDFDDGNTVYLNQATWVMVGSIRVFIGEIFAAIAHAGSSSEVYTNDLSAAAEGTKFLLGTDPLGTTVTVLEGLVRCTPEAGGAWEPFTLTANQQISGTVRSYAGPTPIDAGREARWVDEALRALKRPSALPPPRPN